MNIKALVGEGDHIALLALPFAGAGLIANLLWPQAFRMGFGSTGSVIGWALLAVGVPLWIVSALQILVFVPRGKLIQSGPYALFLHPLYTGVSLFVLPGAGLVLDSWLGFAAGLALYGASRLFAPREEHELAERFGEAYAAYRRRVLLPWL